VLEDNLANQTENEKELIQNWEKMAKTSKNDKGSFETIPIGSFVSFGGGCNVVFPIQKPRPPKYEKLTTSR
jgi:hypothetical protein